MNLAGVYRCFSDETRLRILHLLARGPLCVCHIQAILGAPQVTVSKHLAYLRERQIVTGQRHEQWMIYRLADRRSRELELQLSCLQDCVQSHKVFQDDLQKLKKIRFECDWIDEVIPAPAMKN